MYNEVQLGPTKGQMMDLMDGEEIKLGHHHLSGDIALKLNNAQLKKVQAAAAAGRGCTLKFSKGQIAYHAKTGKGVVGDMAREGYNAIKPAIKGVARGALKFGMDKGANFAKKGVDMASSAIQKKLESLFGIKQGSGAFRGMHSTPAMIKQFEALEQQQGKGFLGDLLGSIGLGIEPGMSIADKHGSGFLGDLLGSIGLGVQMHGTGFLSTLLKKGVHGLVDVAASALGGSVMISRPPKKGKGFISNLLRKGAHGLVDVAADAIGGNVGMPNALANPNEQIQAALFQKKVGRSVAGSGLYLPGRGKGLYMS